MRRFPIILSIVVSATLSLGALPSMATAFGTCADLLQEYPSGVASSKSFKNKGLGPIRAPRVSTSDYAANKRLDVDKDGIACELQQGADTEPIIVNLRPQIYEGGRCSGQDGNVWGKLRNGQVGLLSCNWADMRYLKTIGGTILDPSNFAPVLPQNAPNQATDFTLPATYIIPKVSSSKPKTILSDPADYANLSPCRIKEAEYETRPHMAMGFPIPAERAKLDENLVVQFVPVQFADLKAKSTPTSDFKDVRVALEKFWERMATKKVNLDIRIPDAYFTMPKNIDDYKLNVKFGQWGSTPRSDWPFSKEAAAIADPSIDFSDADVIVIAHLPEAKNSQIAAFTAEAAMPNSSTVIQTDERKIYNILIQGDDEQRDIYNWIHEFGHMLGLTDFGHEGPNDSSNVGKAYYDIMTSYRNMELFVWHRFLLGILEDSQLACVTEGSSTHWLRPVAWPGASLEGVVIPLSSTTALVVESRRRVGYDVLLSKAGEGALVYRIDTSISGSNNIGPVKIIAPKRNNGIDIRTQSVLKPGESVTSDGWKISVVESGGFGDVVKVEKVG